MEKSEPLEAEPLLEEQKCVILSRLKKKDMGLGLFMISGTFKESLCGLRWY